MIDFNPPALFSCNINSLTIVQLIINKSPEAQLLPQKGCQAEATAIYLHFTGNRDVLTQNILWR